MHLHNESQTAAITHGPGPLLCLAGPGSGKTYTLTHRIRYLILEKKVDPFGILVITFSKAAASQMEQRFCQLMNDQYYPVRFGTFHAVFFQILNQYEGYTAKDILTNSQKKQYLKTALLQMDYSGKWDGETMENILLWISYVKNKQSPGCLTEIEKNIPQFHTIYIKYEEVIRQDHKLDFDDMMILCLRLFQKRPDLLSEYRSRIQYLLIDEYQDINKTQYEIVKCLIEPHQNLFAVGDDDQSIYGFRGSDPSVMLRFKQDFQNGDIIFLDQNYRCVKGIVNCANRVIQENKTRYQKQSHALKEGNGVMFKDFASREEEYQALVKNLQSEKGNLSECACLFRTNMEASYFAEYLLKEKIPYVMKEKPYNPYEHFISRDILHYLRLKTGNKSMQELIPVMNRPLRYLSREAIGYASQKEEINFRLLKEFYQEKSYMLKNIKKLEYDLHCMEKMDLFASVNYIRKGIGYDDYLSKQALLQNFSPDAYYKMADEIQKRFGMFNSLEELEKHIHAYCDQIERGVKKERETKSGVQIMTYHASKGLEFDKVYLPGCNEGNTPYKKSVTKEQIEEERRLFYVAMTRARKELWISFIDGKADRKHLVSRFLKDIYNPGIFYNSSKSALSSHSS